MKKEQQQIFSFMDKKTKEIIKNGVIIHNISKSKLLIQYKKKRYICVTNRKGLLIACYLLWS